MKKSTLTILTLMPLFVLIAMVIAYGAFMVSIVKNPNDLAIMETMSGYLWTQVVGSLIFLVIQIALLSLYVIMVNQNESLSNNKRVMWIVLLFLFGAITMFVYLFKHVFKEETTIEIPKALSDGFTKVIVGILTIAPILIMLVVMRQMMGVMDAMFSDLQMASPDGQGDVSAEFISGFVQVMIYQIFSLVIIVGLMIYYIINAVRNALLTDGQKAVWAIMMVVFNVQAMMVYYVVYILLERPDESTHSTAVKGSL